MNTKHSRYALLALVYFILSAYFYSSLLQGGYIINGDYTMVASVQEYLNQFGVLWNEHSGTSSLHVLYKLLIHLPLYLVALLAPETSMTTAYFIYFVCLSSISGISVTLLSEHILFEKESGEILAAEFLILSSAGFVYICSTYVVEQVTHPTIKFAYYLSPLILLMAMRTYKGSISFKEPLALVLLWSFAISDLHWIFFGGIIVFGYGVHSYLYRSAQKGLSTNATVKFASNTLLIFVLFSLVNAYFLVPTLLSGGSSNYQSMLTKEGLDLLFRNANMSSIMSMKGTFILDSKYGAAPITSTHADLNVLLVILTAIGLGGLALFKKNKDITFLGVLYVISVFLSAGPHISPPLYDWFILHAPLNSIYARAFRTPKFHQFLILALAPLIASSGIALFRWCSQHQNMLRKGTAVGFPILILTVSLVANYPLATGDFNGNMNPTGVPEQYDTTLQTLSANAQADDKVIWGPPYGGRTPTWHNQSVGDFPGDISPIPVRQGDSSYLVPLMWSYRVGYPSLVQEGRANPLWKYLSPVGVKYIVVHDDLTGFHTSSQNLIENLNSAEGVNRISTSGNVHLFKVRNSRAKVSVTSAPIGIRGGLSQYSSVAGLIKFNPANHSVVFLDQTSNQDARKSLVVLDGQSALPGRPQFSLHPFQWTTHNAPDRRWSKNYATSSQFRRELAQNGITLRHQSDYRNGVVFTSATTKIEGEPNSKDFVASWNFTSHSDVESWAASSTTTPTHRLHGKEGKLEAVLNNSTWGWKTIKSPKIRVNQSEPYKIDYAVRGDNAHKLHTKIVEFNSNGSVLHSTRIKGVKNGDFGWENESATFSPKNSSTEYIQIQMWHGHNTTKPLPNRILLDDVRVYNMSEYSTPVDLDMEFKVDEAAKYKVYARTLESKAGGEIEIEVDDTVAKIDTKNPLDSFAWNYIGSYRLGEGEHSVTLENIRGLNSVNSIAFVRSNSTVGNGSGQPNQFNSESITYALEAEEDLLLESRSDIRQSRNASAGHFVAFSNNGAVYRNVSIVRSGWYTLTLKGAGTMEVQIGRDSYTVTGADKEYAKIGPVYLAEGSHRISISNKPHQTSSHEFEEVNQSEISKQGYKIGVENSNNTSSLRITTGSTSRGWSGVLTTPMNITPNQTYTLSTRMKYSNVNQTNTLIIGFNKSTRKWQRLGAIPGGKVGTASWRTYQRRVHVPNNVTKIRLALNSGWVLAPEAGNATTWFDNFTIEKEQKASLDAVWLTSSPANKSIERVLNEEPRAASISEFEKVSPVKYRVQVNATGPYMLSFTESFDSHWVAEFQSDTETRHVEPVPLYGTINGFYIEEEGQYTVTLRYRPQRWFRYGAVVSATTLIISLTFLVYSWRWRRGDKWATVFHSRVHAIYGRTFAQLKETITDRARQLGE